MKMKIIRRIVGFVATNWPEESSLAKLMNPGEKQYYLQSERKEQNQKKGVPWNCHCRKSIANPEELMLNYLALPSHTLFTLLGSSFCPHILSTNNRFDMYHKTAITQRNMAPSNTVSVKHRERRWDEGEWKRWKMHTVYLFNKPWLRCTKMRWPLPFSCLLFCVFVPHSKWMRLYCCRFLVCCSRTTFKQVSCEQFPAIDLWCLPIIFDTAIRTRLSCHIIIGISRWVCVYQIIK